MERMCVDTIFNTTYYIIESDSNLEGSYSLTFVVPILLGINELDDYLKKLIAENLQQLSLESSRGKGKFQVFFDEKFPHSEGLGFYGFGTLGTPIK